MRQCEMEGGGTLVEEIVSRDDTVRRYEYRITDAPMPFAFHHASMEVEPVDGGSKVTWITDIAPDELAAGMAPVFDDGIQALKAHLESS